MCWTGRFQTVVTLSTLKEEVVMSGGCEVTGKVVVGRLNELEHATEEKERERGSSFGVLCLSVCQSIFSFSLFLFSLFLFLSFVRVLLWFNDRAVVLSAYPLSFNSQKRVEPEVTTADSDNNWIDTACYFLLAFQILFLLFSIWYFLLHSHRQPFSSES